MKKYINLKYVVAIFVTIGIIFTNQINAETVGSGFSYQGQLLDNNSPANSDYDMIFKAYSDLEGGIANIITSEYLSIPVSNGLFNIENIDFGSDSYQGKTVYLEVLVRKSIDAGSYSTLSPRQRIHATPYSVQSEFSVQAESATNATTADFATSADTSTNATTADFATNADTAANATTANNLAANGANLNDYLQFNGESWNPTPLNHNESQWIPVINNINYPTGRVGINSPVAFARLQVNADIDEDALKVQVDGSTKLVVKKDGSTNISGELNLTENAKQESNKSGMVKYLVKFRCSSNDVSIINSYNGTNTPGAITNEIITDGFNTPLEGKCRLTFPTSLNNRFVLTSIYDRFSQSIANCNQFGNNVECSVGHAGANVIFNTLDYLVVAIY